MPLLPSDALDEFVGATLAVARCVRLSTYPGGIPGMPNHYRMTKMDEFKHANNTLTRFPVLLLIVFLIMPGFMSCKKETIPDKTKKINDLTLLKTGWSIQSSPAVNAKGAIISSPAFQPQGWYPAEVPTTVLAALVKNDVYKKPYFGKNLEKIPEELFKNSWWYRKTFSLPQLEDQYARLIFEGINYRAHIWINGRKIADTTGSFRIFQFDITRNLKQGDNVLAVEVFPPQPGDLTIGFVDWNPAPPDRNMGIWREVKLRFNKAVSVNNAFVQSKVKVDTLDRAQLTVTAELVNHGATAVSGMVKGQIETIGFQQPFSLKPLEKKEITFDPSNSPGLDIANPRLWWPVNLGEPNLYTLKLTASVDNHVSDRQEITFGIREVSDYINPSGHRGYKVNGKKVLIRGGGWVDDLMLADSDEKVEAQMKYVRHMNLNTVRLEGFWGSSRKLYSLADQYGILLMAGWSCHWEWEEYLGKPVDQFGGIKTPAEMDLVARSLRDQVIWLRNHPSLFVWVLGSDMLPRPELEKRYRSDLALADPSRPILGACKYMESGISGPTAVKMAGPYDYVPPVYWYVDKKNGGAFGFNTETGPGPQPPPLESIRRMIPEENRWPIDDMWDYHCGRHEFNTLERYNTALEQRYGKPGSLESYARTAQLANYEAMRAMFEAFGVNKPNATGVIQWMLNSAWPEMYWQLYDHYLMPNGAFYGAKTGSQPLNIVYHYGDGNIYVVNDTLTDYENIKAKIRILDLDSKELYSKTLDISIGENRSQKVLDFPSLKNLPPVYFVDLRLKDSAGQLVGNNFYWLSRREDVLDESKATWYYTPQSQYADFSALHRLPPVKINTQHRFESRGSDRTLTVTLENPTDKIAFFIELRVLKGDTGESVLPIFWEDNYITLLPGEIRTITAHFNALHLETHPPTFHYNLAFPKTGEINP